MGHVELSKGGNVSPPFGKACLPAGREFGDSPFIRVFFKKLS
jgi:hypothetical protein